MTVNSLSPGFVELHYSADISGRFHPHVATYPIIPSGAMTVGNVPNFITNDDNDDTATSLTNAWVDLFKVVFNSGFTFTRSDIYSQPNPEDDPLFIISIAHGDVGTSLSPTVALGQLSIHCRTELGGIARLNLMESVIAVNTQDSFPFANASLDALADYALSNVGWIRGRDGGKFSTVTRYTSKTNDALRKKYFLNP